MTEEQMQEWRATMMIVIQDLRQLHQDLAEILELLKGGFGKEDKT